MDLDILQKLENELPLTLRNRLDQAAAKIIQAKKRGGKVAVVTGSGPNIHEGVTTLIAELIRIGLIDGVTTSSAVVAHEMAGSLDRVKRISGLAMGIDPGLLPRGGDFELTEMDDAALHEIGAMIPVDQALIDRMKRADGKTIIKAAGNLGYPMGLWIESLTKEILSLAQVHKLSFEQMVGLGSDDRTMIGIGAQTGVPVLVTIPQLIGGGSVGLAIGDSISIAERASRVAHLLDDADVIIESGVALTQEIHDGPFETYTGHGMWSAWNGDFTYSLQNKSLIRIDLDPSLERVWEIEHSDGEVQSAISEGLPKTKLFNVPFRMEMSGFARIEGSLPLIGDLGVIWPLLIRRVAEAMSLPLQFMSYPQQSEKGMLMREYIVREIKPVSRARMLEHLHSLTHKAGTADPAPTTISARG